MYSPFLQLRHTLSKWGIKKPSGSQSKTSSPWKEKWNSQGGAEGSGGLQQASRGGKRVLVTVLNGKGMTYQHWPFPWSFSEVSDGSDCSSCLHKLTPHSVHEQFNSLWLFNGWADKWLNECVGVFLKCIHFILLTVCVGTARENGQRHWTSWSWSYRKVVNQSTRGWESKLRSSSRAAGSLVAEQPLQPWWIQVNQVLPFFSTLQQAAFSSWPPPPDALPGCQQSRPRFSTTGHPFHKQTL